MASYQRTLITLAGDSPVQAGTIPKPRGGKRTVAVIQYEMIASDPYAHQQDDVLFASWFERQGFEDIDEEEKAALREQFFSKPQPCLRASPLPKQYGWGVHYDEHGRVALIPAESSTYRELLSDPDVTTTAAMRRKRK